MLEPEHMDRCCSVLTDSTLKEANAIKILNFTAGSARASWCSALHRNVDVAP